MVGRTYRSGPKSGRWRFIFCTHIALLGLILYQTWQTHGHARIYCLQACQQERGRKPFSVDFAIQLAWRFIYPEFLKFARQGFVAYAVRLHRAHQGLVGKFLPSLPNTCLFARVSGRMVCHWYGFPSAKTLILPKFGRIRPISQNQQIEFLYFSRAIFFGPTC